MDKKNNNQTNYAPVVSVLGHVDHGKTTLLDKIRETGVAERETGGITQKIGASKIEFTHEGNKRSITFIDTPGHAAFSNMRSQGVSAADIVLLVIAADDGIKPQTKESISKILEAKIPFIIVFTKIDMERAIIDKVKSQVLKEGIMLEGQGGDVPFIGVSSKTGEKIKDLLDLILLVYDMKEIKKDKNTDFMGVVIDAKVDKRRGNLSSIVIKQGTLSIGTNLFAHGMNVGKIKAIIDAKGVNTNEIVAGDAGEVLGVNEVLDSGTVIYDHEVELIKAPVSTIVAKTPEDIMQFLNEEEKDFVPIVLKTETAAELVAIKESLPEKIRVIYEGQGEITVSDILMGKDFHALVIGFNVKAVKEAEKLAEVDKVFYKSYGIIYEMLDELEQLITAVSTKPIDKELGRAKIQASFLGTEGAILGLKIIEGRLAVGDRIKIFRDEKEMGSSEIISIKKGKTDAKLVQKNDECGIMIEPLVDFAESDVIIAYSKTASR
jgi:translation initiation factor IF-2